LINDAAIGGDQPFFDASMQHELDQIGVNVTALVALSHAAARRMTDAGHGTIINISSIAGNQPRRGAAVYGATKAFVTSFSQSLASDLEGTGVRCTLVIPGLTDTEFHRINGFTETSPRALFMHPTDVAAKALDAAAGRPPGRDSGHREQSAERPGDPPARVHCANGRRARRSRS
jgi:short-subunit dehydrogenase